jgi:hypothetical protein
MTPDDPMIWADNDNRSAQVIQIESSKLLPMMVLLAALSVAGIISSLCAWSEAPTARTEARMAEYYITRLDALLVEQGNKKAGDDFTKFRKEHKE